MRTVLKTRVRAEKDTIGIEALSRVIRKSVYSPIIALASARGPILPPPNHPSLKNVHFPSIFASSEWKIEIAKKKFFEFFENF
jgi:hypothetical protein